MQQEDKKWKAQQHSFPPQYWHSVPNLWLLASSPPFIISLTLLMPGQQPDALGLSHSASLQPNSTHTGPADQATTSHTLVSVQNMLTAIMSRPLLYLYLSMSIAGISLCNQAGPRILPNHHSMFFSSAGEISHKLLVISNKDCTIPKCCPMRPQSTVHDNP